MNSRVYTRGMFRLGAAIWGQGKKRTEKELVLARQNYPDGCECFPFLQARKNISAAREEELRQGWRKPQPDLTSFFVAICEIFSSLLLQSFRDSFLTDYEKLKKQMQLILPEYERQITHFRLVFFGGAASSEQSDQCDSRCRNVVVIVVFVVIQTNSTPLK